LLGVESDLVICGMNMWFFLKNVNTCMIEYIIEFNM